MARFDLLALDLHAPLRYRRVPARLPFAAEAGSDELLYAYEADELLRFDEDEGPRSRAELPPPRDLGVAATDGGIGPADLALAKGRYAFMQFRPTSAAELMEGIEWFARETWWEGSKLEGPFFVRVLVEDGFPAFQILRSLARISHGEK